MEPWNRTEELIGAVAAYHAARPDLPPLAVTCRDRKDGAGAQALGVASALLWANATGCRYVHTPFARVGHAVGNRQAWTAKWEAFFNLGQGESPAPASGRYVSIREFLQEPLAYADPGTILAAGGYHCPRLQTPAALQELRSLLRTKYYAIDRSHLARRRDRVGALTVAVHVRRGDVTLADPRRVLRYTADEGILRTIEGVRAIAAVLSRRARIYLYSEGKPDAFAAFAAAGCRLRLSMNTFKTFHHLVEADILVQARSCFSYLAGLLSTGVVLHDSYEYEDGRSLHLPAPDWIRLDRTGAFAVEKPGALLDSKHLAGGNRRRWHRLLPFIKG